MREYLEEKTPQRSDYSPSEVDASIVNTSDQKSSSSTSIPELDKLHRLEADPEKLVYDHGNAPVDDYVATEYYKDLNCIDKQHHTTGTGFIKVAMEKKDTGLINLLGLPAPPNPSSRNASSLSSCRGNPATNEWIPSTEIPTKPNGSEPDG